MLSLSLPASPDMLSHAACEESCAGGILAAEEGQGGGGTVPSAWLPEDALPGSCLLLAASTLCTPHLGWIHSCCLLRKNIVTAGGKTWKSKFITNSCWEQKQVLNLPLHGPTCPTLAASPCPHAVICRTGCSGSWLPEGKPGQCWGAATPNSSTAVPTAACHAGDWLPTPLQARHSYVLQLGPP